MTDPTLTPEIYGDYDLHLSRVRDANLAKVKVIAGPSMEERAKHVERAREVMKRPDIHTRTVVWDAAAVLRAWGDYADHIMADAVMFSLDKRDWDEIDRKMQEANAKLRAAHQTETRLMGLLIVGFAIVALFIVATLVAP